MGHGLALKLVAGALGLWLLAMALLLALASPPGPGQRTVVVFPPATGAEGALRAVSRADGVIVQGTWWPDAWIVVGRTADWPQPLFDQGAVWVLPAAPFRLAAVGGCGFPVFRWRLGDTV